MHIRSLLATLLCLIFLTACKDTPQCPQCDKTMDQFMQQVQAGDTQSAFDNLFRSSLFDKEVIYSNVFTQSTANLLKKYGAVDTYERVATKSKGRLYTVEYYMYQKRGVSRWVFYYYNIENQGWKLANLDATDNYADFEKY